MKVTIGPYPKPKSKAQRKVAVTVEDHDLWNLDHTLALIIHPALVKFRNTGHGAPYVADEDVPEKLRSTKSKKKKNSSTDSNHFKRWDYVLDEMIYAFEAVTKDDAMSFPTDRVSNGLKLFGKYYINLWN